MVTSDLNVNVTNVEWVAMGDITSGNGTTGANSTNDASADVTNTLTLVNTNDSTVNTTSTIDANSGGNNSNNNTGSGSSESGNSSVMFGVINAGNGNFTLIQ